MNRDIVTVGALLVVGVASCIGWSQNMAGKARLVSPPDQSQQPRRDETKIITIADGTRGEKRSVDTGSDGPSQGDLFVFDQPLMDQYRRDIGTNSGCCVTTKSGAHGQCQWTLKFEAGSIVVAGQEAENGKSALAVIGTTGKFSGFLGEMSSEPKGDGTFLQELTLFRPQETKGTKFQLQHVQDLPSGFDGSSPDKRWSIRIIPLPPPRSRYAGLTVINFTPYEAYLIIFGYFGWPLTGLLAIVSAGLGYRAVPPGWRIFFLMIAAIFVFPIVTVWTPPV